MFILRHDEDSTVVTKSATQLCPGLTRCQVLPHLHAVTHPTHKQMATCLGEATTPSTHVHTHSEFDDAMSINTACRWAHTDLAMSAQKEIWLMMHDLSLHCSIVWLNVAGHFDNVVHIGLTFNQVKPVLHRVIPKIFTNAIAPFHPLMKCSVPTPGICRSSDTSWLGLRSWPDVHGT